jgi:hypothetical protein
MSRPNSPKLFSQLLLSLLTPTIICGKMSSESLINLFEDMGKASEEIFRGERLPILKDHYSDS